MVRQDWDQKYSKFKIDATIKLHGTNAASLKSMLQLSCMDLKEFEGKVRGAVDIGFGDNLLRLPTIFNTIPDYKYPFDDLVL